MENTPLLLWWEIAFSPFPFENFTADLARPGSKSKLGFSVLLQYWLCIDISHCFWNQPEKMSLCREQAEMSQKNRWAAWAIPWKQSRRGKGFSHCPPCPRSCPLGKENPGAITTHPKVAVPTDGGRKSSQWMSLETVWAAPGAQCVASRDVIRGSSS